VFGADHEAAADHVRNDDNRLGPLEQVLRNTIVRGLRQIIEHLHGVVNASDFIPALCPGRLRE